MIRKSHFIIGKRCTALFLGLLLLAVVPSRLWAQAPPKQHADVLEYIEQYKLLAIAEMKRTGVPAAVKLAQGIHETQAGKSDLVQRSNNHFGIKCKSTWRGASVTHDDDARGECFRAYPNAEDSYRDHSDFLKNNQRYAALFKLDPLDYKGWAQGLKAAGYATNPRYPQLIVKYIEEYQLQAYSEMALGKKSIIEFSSLKGNEQEPISITPTPAQISTTGKDQLLAPTTNGTGKVNAGEAAITQDRTTKWPTGVFTINGTKVVFQKAGTSTMAIAVEQQLSLSKLFEYNDMPACDVLPTDMLIFLQKKKKIGEQDWYVVQSGESLHAIAQHTGMRLESLLAFNQLQANMKIQPGARLALRKKNDRAVPLLQNSGTVLWEGEKQKERFLTAQQMDATRIVHVVQPKETLYSIARVYQVTIDQLKEWNLLKSDALQIGQKLLIQKTAHGSSSSSR